MTFRELETNSNGYPAMSCLLPSRSPWGVGRRLGSTMLVPTFPMELITSGSDHSIAWMEATRSWRRSARSVCIFAGTRPILDTNSTRTECRKPNHNCFYSFQREGLARQTHCLICIYIYIYMIPVNCDHIDVCSDQIRCTCHLISFHFDSSPSPHLGEKSRNPARSKLQSHVPISSAFILILIEN